MKKTIAIFIGASLLLATNTAYASTSTEQLIAQLQQQITALSVKLTALRQAQNDVVSTQQSINSTLGLIGNLSEGMSGEEVRLLQATLANDASIYPEGKVTGYYGKLTREAVKRFQKKHGLLENGSMSTETTKKINHLLSGLSIAKEHDEDDGDDDRGHKNKNDHEDNDRDNKGSKKHFCLSGGEDIWKKNNNGKHRGWEKLILPRCKHLPNNNGTTTPPTLDTTAPAISAILGGSITAGGATITWTTSEAAASKLYVAKVSPVATSGALWADATLRTTHTATLTALTANTLYYYVIEASDAKGNKTLAAQGSFTTLSNPDIVVPVISGFSVAPTSSTTGTVVWTTNEAASTKVYYGITTPLATSSALSMFDAAFTTTHNKGLTGLSASTTYYVVAESRDVAGNTAVTSQSMFTTNP